MMITLATEEASAMPVYGPDNPARTTTEQLTAIDAGAYVNERYELVYPEHQAITRLSEEFKNATPERRAEIENELEELLADVNTF